MGTQFERSGWLSALDGAAFKWESLMPLFCIPAIVAESGLFILLIRKGGTVATMNRKMRRALP